MQSKSASGVRIPASLPLASIAQLDRVLGYEPSGRRFESSWMHHSKKLLAYVLFQLKLRLTRKKIVWHKQFCFSGYSQEKQGLIFCLNTSSKNSIQKVFVFKPFIDARYIPTVLFRRDSIMLC